MIAVRRHVAGFAGLTAEERGDVLDLTALAERALETEYRPHGINAGANLGRVAGAGFPGHLHLHLVPRWNGDTNFMPVVASTRVLSEGLGRTWARLRRAVRVLERKAAGRAAVKRKTSRGVPVAKKGGGAARALIIVLAVVVVALVVSSARSTGAVAAAPAAVGAGGSGARGGRQRIGREWNRLARGLAAARRRIPGGGDPQCGAIRLLRHVRGGAAQRSGRSPAVSRYLGGPPVIRQVWGPNLADVSLVIGSDRSRLRLGE